MIDIHSAARRFGGRLRDGAYILSCGRDAIFALRELHVKLRLPEHLHDKPAELSLVGRSHVTVRAGTWSVMLPIPPHSWVDFHKLDAFARYVEGRGWRIRTADGQWAERSADQAIRAIVATLDVSTEEAAAIAGACESNPWTLDGKGPRSWQL